MNDRMYRELREAIQIEYEEKLEALDKLKGLMGGGSPKDAPGVDLAPRKRKPIGDMSEEERKAAKRAYMKAYMAKRKANAGIPLRKAKKHANGDEKGLPLGKFKKYLVPGPAAAGGTGEE